MTSYENLKSTKYEVYQWKQINCQKSRILHMSFSASWSRYERQRQESSSIERCGEGGQRLLSLLTYMQLKDWSAFYERHISFCKEKINKWKYAKSEEPNFTRENGQGSKNVHKNYVSRAFLCWSEETTINVGMLRRSRMWWWAMLAECNLGCC